MNLANLRTLVTHCTYLGTGYNPANTDLTLTAVNALAAACQTAQNDLVNALPVLKDEMGARAVAFKTMMPLLTRILAAHATSSTNEALKEMAKSIVREMRGKRVKALPKTTDGEPSEEAMSAVNVGFENRAADFARLVAVLNSDSEYKSNQPALTKAALATLLTQLQEANAAVRNAQAPVDMARTARNAKFYTGEKNLVDTALLMKQELKSMYGTTGPQYKQVSGLKFTRPKK